METDNLLPEMKLASLSEKGITDLTRFNVLKSSEHNFSKALTAERAETRLRINDCNFIISVILPLRKPFNQLSIILYIINLSVF